MTNEHKAEFGLILAALAETFDRELSEVVVGVYWQALQRLSIEEFQTAARKAVESCKFMPRPAELLEFATGSAEDRALLAWDRAWTAVSRVGSYQSPEFDDPLIAQTIKSMGGWVAFCLTEEPEWGWRKRFIETYETFVRRGGIAAVPRLRGLADDRERLDRPPTGLVRLGHE